MWWRVIFIAVVCLLLVLLVTMTALAFGHSPGWLTSALFLDFGIVLGAVKTVVDTTKSAEEIVRLGFEVQKMQLEIRKLRRAEDRDIGRVVIPTDEQIERYGSKRSAGPTVSVMGSSLVIVAVAAVGFLLSLPMRRLYFYRPLGGDTAPPDLVRQNTETFDCGQGRLILNPDSEIEFSNVGEYLPPSDVTVLIHSGRLTFPLIRSSSDPESKRNTYIANPGGDVQFRLNDEQIEIDSNDGSTKLACSPAKEDSQEPSAK